MKLFKHSWLAALVMLTLLLSACGGDAATATTAPAAATNTTAPAAVATDTPAAAAVATDTPAMAAVATDTPAMAAEPTATVEPTAVALGSSSAKTTITIWHGWAGNYLAAKQAVFAAYVQAHPDVAIKLLNVPSIGDKVKNAVPAGVGPDIIAWVDDNIGQNALINVIDPIDGMAGIDQSFLKANYSDVAANAVTYNGKIYALPESVEAVTFIYNKKLITADQLPKTTTELRQKMADYGKANPGSYYAVWDPTQIYYDAAFVYGAGGQYVDEAGTVGLNTPETIAAGEFIRSLQGLLPKDIDYNVADGLFKDGKAGMIINGPWYVSDLQKAGIDYGFAKIPAVDFGKGGPSRPFVGVKCLMLAHGSKNADVALDIMKFYTSAEQETAMVKQTGEVPANTAAAAAVSSDPTVKGFNDQAVDGVPLPNTPFMGALWDPGNKAFTAVYNSSTDVKQIMADSQKVAEESIAKMK